MKYRVHDGTSVRKSPDPKSAQYDEWLHFEEGQVVSKWPAHADVEGWVASGHWAPVEKLVEDDDGDS